MIEEVREKVYKLLEKDNSGHGNDHINRVLKMSLKFAEREQSNKEVVALIALLHDVDDYKLFGEEQANSQTNAKRIMQEANVDENLQKHVLQELSRIGYSRLLKGIRPQTIEGKIVSDADMCDAIGANGIIRTHVYTLANDKPFFDKKIYPIEDMNENKYNRKCSDSSVCHFLSEVI